MLEVAHRVVEPPQRGGKDPEIPGDRPRADLALAAHIPLRVGEQKAVEGRRGRAIVDECACFGEERGRDEPVSVEREASKIVAGERGKPRPRLISSSELD